MAPIYGKDTLRQSKWNDYKNASTNPYPPASPGPETWWHYEIKLDPTKDAATYDFIVKSRGSDPNAPSIDTLTTLKYVYYQKGTAPTGGFPLYIALHGGGATSTANNDHEWAIMAGSYQGRIQDGVYVSIRGIGDTWDLHCTPASYVLIERLIQNMILFGNVNSNRVYLMGFSAGGDGSFRLGPRLAQRWAAANIAAGDPGEEPMVNLMNVATCLQVGEMDTSIYLHRSQHMAQKNDDLDKLQAIQTALVKPQATTAYTHTMYIHPGGSHNDWEQPNFSVSSPTQAIPDVAVIKNVGDWLSKYNNDTAQPTTGLPTYNTKTNAIDWLNSKTRQPIPSDVVWDMSIKPFSPGYNDRFTTEVLSNLTGKNQNYWLAIDNYDVAAVGPVIWARIEPANNKIIVYQAQKYVRILLRLNMWDTTKPITVVIGKQTILTPAPREENLTIIQQTLARNDAEFVFNGDVILTQASNGNWSVTQTPVPSSPRAFKL